MIEPSGAGSPLPPLFIIAGFALTLSGCTEPAELDWPIQDASRAVSSAFGPRLKASDNFRYDFHRGIDLPVPLGTPVVAMADGIVRIAGLHSSYQDNIIQVAHGDGCTGQPENCWFSGYLHVSEWVVDVGDTVRAGQVLGYSGASESGFEHLHFEVREGTLWQQGAVNPARWLGLGDTGGPEIRAMVSNGAVQIDVSVSAGDLDLEGLMAEVIDDTGKVIASHRYEPEVWNHTYTHPEPEWPAPDCTHAHLHPQGSEYDPHVHLDQASFNGAQLEPGRFDTESDDWRLHVALNVDLTDVAHVRVRAWDVHGAETIVLAKR